ncbi:MAG: hypothetical protein HFJ48_07495 [Clostridia bacterium]|nr:hypothetical protein [Clostridia bacterium]
MEEDKNLKYYNEYGGFSQDGKEYIIKINKDNRLPAVWSNILANENFGTIVTENMGGYTWYKNSRLNRVTAWNNSSTMDIPSEIIYLKDKEKNIAWSLGANPMPDDNDYNIIYGFGYSKYIHQSANVIQEVEVFVPREDNCKVNIITLKNTEPTKKKLKLIYYIKPVISEDEIKSNGFIDVELEKNNNVIIARNLYDSENNNQLIYVSSSEKIHSFTGSKKNFLGGKGLSNPEGVNLEKLDESNGIGNDSCVAIEFDIDLESFETKEISLILGAIVENEGNIQNNIESKQINTLTNNSFKDISYKYSKIQNCKIELERVKRYWSDLLGRVHVETPLESMNIMLNGWIMYQTIACRLMGKTGFYQSGGAFGFRDQLQDTLGTKFLDIEIMKKQIIKHSSHQFLEGDVEHWWHEETQRGIRTKFSDDLLWLAFLVIQYIDFTGDYSILDIQTPYLKGEILKENEDEKYDKYENTQETGSILEHCIKAINKSLNFGEHNLPKIGTGDWNDGFSEVGNKGIGESVWLGFFQYYIFDNFIPICEEWIKLKENSKETVEEQKQQNQQEKSMSKELQETTELVEKLNKIKIDLKKALNSSAWDGRWFKRAFCDDGSVLGTIENEECKIDSIAQSWSVISNGGDNDKKYISMESLENYLIDRENGIIKLLDPPFEKSKLEPGYIKAYLPGVRENGGQYTHAAIWAIIAETLLGFGDKALELYRMISPIEHTRTRDASNKYKVEPYVIAADIYGAKNLAGRGGWTWYTGSSSWYYLAGIEYILGLKVKKGMLTVNPCIPKDWKEYSIRFRFGESLYKIKVINNNMKNTGVEKLVLNGNEVPSKEIRLVSSGGIYDIDVVM